MLLEGLRGTWPPPGTTRGFSLGRLGLPVDIAAVAWCAAMAVDLGWPRQEVYDSVEPHHRYLQYGAPLAVGTTVLGGLALHRGRLRARAGVLPEHLAEAPSPG